MHSYWRNLVHLSTACWDVSTGERTASAADFGGRFCGSQCASGSGRVATGVESHDKVLTAAKAQSDSRSQKVIALARMPSGQGVR